MAWTPPRESERPHGFECFGYVEANRLQTIGYGGWEKVVWHKSALVDGHWYISHSGEEVKPTAFFPLSQADPAARIAELEAEIERLRKSRRDAVYRFMLGIVLSEEGCDTPKANGEVGLCFIRPGQSCICRAKAAALTNRVLMAITVAMEDTP
jgi:hypothetical protein